MSFRSYIELEESDSYHDLRLCCSVQELQAMVQSVAVI